MQTDRLFSDVAAVSERIMGAAHVETIADMACRTATDYHTVAHIAFPVDLQSAEMSRDKRSKRNIAGHSSDVPVDDGVMPPVVDLKLAAAISV